MGGSRPPRPGWPPTPSRSYKELVRLATAACPAAVLLSPSSRTVLAEDRARSGRTLKLVRDRTGAPLGITLGDVGDTDAWGLSRQIGPTSPAGPEDPADLATQLHMALAHDPSQRPGPEIGPPVTVVAMTADEATELFADAPAPIAAPLELTGGSIEPLDDPLRRRARSRWQPLRGERRDDRGGPGREESRRSTMTSISSRAGPSGSSPTRSTPCCTTTSSCGPSTRP